MKEAILKNRWKKAWLSLTIKKKLRLFTGVVFLIIFLSVTFDIWVVNFALNDFKIILEDNARSSEFMDAIEVETEYFAAYIKNPTDERLEELERACRLTKRTINRLPYDYEEIGDWRYGQTWSIHNGYEAYEEKRSYVLKMDEAHPSYIQALYEVYDMQGFLQDYARSLMRYTLEGGNSRYISQVPMIRRIPFVIFIFGMILFTGIVSLSHLMNQTIILPIVHLVEVSKKIARNEFFVEDVRVESEDEMGELVEAFNKMKDATGQYILALEEKREMAHLLHQEELEKIEIEKRLERTNLELLKNQIKPHFLFNTLNVIGGMANLENAKTTEKMIKALSSLFRYNLKTPESEVTLTQELQVVRDYMYLQQMRFGSRINYQIECKIDAQRLKMPTFSFQPLVENAIIHGLSKKEEGGRIYIRIWLEKGHVIISVADTGIGMTKEALYALRNAFMNGATEQSGIGLGNIYKRIQNMYPTGDIEVFSKHNIGTVVRMKIPQVMEEVEYVSNTNSG